MDTKSPLESKGIQGALLVLITYFIFNYTDLEITELEVSSLMESIFVIGGALYAAYGRWVAENPISLFADNTIKIDTRKLSDVENKALRALLEKTK